MKAVTHGLYYGYIGLVIVAGLWGAFINPEFDHRWLFHLDVHSLDEYSRVNMLSQYRFLRALELGFGIFCSVQMKQIFTRRKYNLLFLTAMGAGILARISSLINDGRSSTLMLCFLVYELIAWAVIVLYSANHIYRQVSITKGTNN
jgi:hypothetical protein